MAIYMFSEGNHRNYSNLDLGGISAILLQTFSPD